MSILPFVGAFEAETSYICMYDQRRWDCSSKFGEPFLNRVGFDLLPGTLV
jgi:hypothetical protein